MKRPKAVDAGFEVGQEIVLYETSPRTGKRAIRLGKIIKKTTNKIICDFGYSSEFDLAGNTLRRSLTTNRTSIGTPTQEDRDCIASENKKRTEAQQAIQQERDDRFALELKFPAPFVPTISTGMSEGHYEVSFNLDRGQVEKLAAILSERQ